jgi:hypothetical protein
MLRSTNVGGGNGGNGANVKTPVTKRECLVGIATKFHDFVIKDLKIDKTNLNRVFLTGLLNEKSIIELYMRFGEKFSVQPEACIATFMSSWGLEFKQLTKEDLETIKGFCTTIFCFVKKHFKHIE